MKKTLVIKDAKPVIEALIAANDFVEVHWVTGKTRDRCDCGRVVTLRTLSTWTDSQKYNGMALEERHESQAGKDFVLGCLPESGDVTIVSSDANGDSQGRRTTDEQK